MSVRNSEIAVYGGTFDPPHEGHLLVVNYLLQNFSQVIVEPVGNHDFGKKISAAEDRLAMLRMILMQQAIIDLFEVRKAIEKPKDKSYTFETLLYLQSLFPINELVLVIGSDNLLRFHEWNDHNGQPYTKMLERFKVYVYPRKGYPMRPLYQNMYPIENVEAIATSSTEVRERVKENGNIGELVKPEVEKYIKGNHLFKK